MTTDQPGQNNITDKDLKRHEFLSRFTLAALVVANILCVISVSEPTITLFDAAWVISTKLIVLFCFIVATGTGFWTYSIGDRIEHAGISVKR